jgi:molybdenum cofactor cytidylyltransferase
MTMVSGVLLAAGESRRMGTLNKLALPVAGEPLLRRSVRTFLASGLDELVVVLGHEAEQAEALLENLDVTVVHNKQYEQGQMTSVYRGLEALSATCDGVMIALADQPLLTREDINVLIDGFVERRRGSVLVPTHGGRRGNPIVLAWEHRETILGGGRNLGCKKLIERNPELVETLEMDTDRVVFDLDTPEDYACLQERLGTAADTPLSPQQAGR